MCRHRIIRQPCRGQRLWRTGGTVAFFRRIWYDTKKGRRLRRKESVCMEPGFIDLTAENIADQHLCCIIRSKKPHPGVEAKRRWLADRLPEGHVFRKLDVKEKVFIEYAPLETAWVPVEGDNYLYLYCLWVAGAYKGKGYGRALMEHCLADARDRGKSGVCMLGAEKQKAWLSDQSFARRYGFETADETDYGYTLLARSFDGTLPRFTGRARAGTIE